MKGTLKFYRFGPIHRYEGDESHCCPGNLRPCIWAELGPQRWPFRCAYGSETHFSRKCKVPYTFTGLDLYTDMKVLSPTVALETLDHAFGLNWGPKDGRLGVRTGPKPTF